MRNYSVAVIVLLVGLCAVSVLAKNCEPGTRVLDDDGCNYCTCMPDGTKGACTRKFCFKGPQYPSVRSTRQVAEEPVKCEPSSRFLDADGCNWCTCSRDGKLAACTKKTCVKVNLDIPDNTRSKRQTQPKVCEPFSTFKDTDGCNTCRCSADGTQSACTRKFCLPETDRQTQEAKICEPLSTYKDADGCNTCRCNAEGTRGACTRKFCLPTPQPETRPKRETKEEKVCEPYSDFNHADGCNTCRCNEDGTHAACTKKFCLTIPQPETRSKRQTQEAKICEPLSTYKDADGCNTCRCNAEGTRGACTRKFCLPTPQPETRPKREAQDKVCEPYSDFNHADGCNTCRCNEDGTHAACTKKLCLTIPQPETRSKRAVEGQVCEPNSVFRDADDCNDCRCSTDGRHFSCTKMACIPNLLERQKRELYCEPNSNFKKDCNYCKCNADGTMAACTLRYCFSDQRVRRDVDAEQYCEPRSTFKQDCNTCKCSDDGKSAACTLMFCLRQRRYAVVQPIGPKQVCEPNSSFMDDDNCNTCNCNSEGTAAACTLKACFTLPDTVAIPAPHRDRRETKQICEPNTTFKKDCNTCHCSADGMAEYCTEIGCITTDNFPVVRRTRQAPDEVCEPNSSFKKDCNTCICNGDGTAAFCTQIGCIDAKQLALARRTRETGQVCEPNSSIPSKDTCNTCTCHADGLGVSCTERLCPILAGSDPLVCTPNSVFKRDCNTCKCSSDGTRAFCTRRMCNARDTREVHGAVAEDAAAAKGEATTPEAEEKEVSQQTPCTPEEIKIEGCNRCKCAKNGIGWFCTAGSACSPNGNNNHH